MEGPVNPVEQAYSTDGLTDRFVHRPCARPLVRLLMRLPVTPNAVTLAGLVLGVMAAAQFWYATPQSAMFGLLLFFLQAVVDHADGESRTPHGAGVGVWPTTGRERSHSDGCPGCHGHGGDGHSRGGTVDVGAGLPGWVWCLALFALHQLLATTCRSPCHTRDRVSLSVIRSVF